jgi:N-hydroxyarylamine O-acetyltransferase
VDTEAYLRRLGLHGPPAGDIEGLRLLQRAHLEAVPFENSS